MYTLSRNKLKHTYSKQSIVYNLSSQFQLSVKFVLFFVTKTKLLIPVTGDEVCVLLVVCVGLYDKCLYASIQIISWLPTMISWGKQQTNELLKYIFSHQAIALAHNCKCAQIRVLLLFAETLQCSAGSACEVWRH